MEIVKSIIKIRENQIRIDSLKINYKIIGDGNIPIILLHGWGVNSDKYAETVNQLFLKTKNYGLKTIIVIPDLPGFGKSDAPREVWGVDEYVEFVRKFTDILKLDNFILIGHSFGGQIAIKFAVKHLEKLKALILTGAAGIRHSPALKQKIFYILAKTGKIIFSLLLINKMEKTAQKLLYKAAREKDYYAASGVMREVFKKVTKEDLTNCLEKIKIPTLLVWGRNDHSTPLVDGQLMSLKIVNCKLEIVGEANHSLLYQYPEKFAKIVVEFIKNL